MSSTTSDAVSLTTGRWRLDRTHSTVGFEVLYMGVAPFEGVFRDVDATVVEGRIEGTARAASVDVDDENLAGHLRSPDFFHVEEHPRLRFAGALGELEGGEVVVEGELAIRDITRPVRLDGTLAGPIDDPYGNRKLALDLATTVNRHDFGLSWNAPLPNGGSILGDDVRLRARLVLVRDA